MINFIKARPTIFILIAVVLVILVIVVITELRRPSSQLPLAEVEIVETFETNLSNVSIAPGEINISARMNSIENFQEEVSVVTYTPFTISDEFVQKANSTVNVDQISREQIEGAGEIIDSRNGPRNLITYKDIGTLIYSDMVQFTPNVDYTFDGDANVQEYRSRAEGFVRSMGININKYELTATQYLTYPTSEPNPILNLSAAGLIEFTYTAKDEEISIIDADYNLDPNKVTIWIDKDFVVRKANISTVGTTGNTTARLKAKTIDELKESINSGEAMLINSSFGADTKILFTAVERAELMYYASDDRLIPVYIIDATLISEKGEEGTGKLIVKAF